MVYVMSDIHGQFNAFIDVLEQINFSDNDTLYILGDIIDRGPKPMHIYEYIRKKDNIILLMGNHEELMLNALDISKINVKDEKVIEKRMFSNLLLWFSNGGEITNKKLNKYRENNTYQDVLDYFRDLPFYKIVEINNQKYVLCHAGIMYNKDYDLVTNLDNNIKDDTILWNRDFYGQQFPENLIVIHGHTQTLHMSDSQTIVKYNNGKSINIDCGCASERLLGCLRLDDMKEFYSSKMQERKC